MRPRPGESSTEKGPAAQRWRQRCTGRPDRPTRGPASACPTWGVCVKEAGKLRALDRAVRSGLALNLAAGLL